MKRSNIQIIGVPEEEDKKKGHEKILSDSLISTILSSISLILSSASIILFVPSRVFLISFIALYTDSFLFLLGPC